MSILVHEYSYEDEMRVAKQEGLEQGLEQGLVQGREEERTESARRMKEKSMDAALISEVTGLTEAEIAEIRPKKTKGARGTAPSALYSNLPMRRTPNCVSDFLPGTLPSSRNYSFSMAMSPRFRQSFVFRS
jgi:hypothetical protein